MPKLTPVEKQERAEFTLQRLKRGFSFAEVQKQFCKEFNVHSETSRKWVNWACDQMAEQDTPGTRKRIFFTIVEMYHDQIVSYQNELLLIQKEIDALTNTANQRTAILQELRSARGGRHRELMSELSCFPEIGNTVKAGLIEAKTRVRERMYRVMNDLARLRGFNGVQSDWRQALNTLLDNNLIPPAIADGILTVIDNFEGNIRAIEAQDVEANLEDGLPDPADIDLPDFDV